METLSLKQAAEATGRTKPTILKAIQNGKVIANKRPDGQWLINTASLAQSYDFIQSFMDVHSSSRSSSTEPPRTTQFNDTISHEIIELRAEVRLLSERLNDRNEQVCELKTREQALSDEKLRYIDLLEKQSVQLIGYHGEPQQVKKTSNAGLAIFMTILIIVATIAVFYLLSAGLIETPLQIQDLKTLL